MAQAEDDVGCRIGKLATFAALALVRPASRNRAQFARSRERFGLQVTSRRRFSIERREQLELGSAYPGQAAVDGHSREEPGW